MLSTYLTLVSAAENRLYVPVLQSSEQVLQIEVNYCTVCRQPTFCHIEKNSDLFVQ